MWNSEQFKGFVDRRLRDFRPFCDSHREPYSRAFTVEGIKRREPVGGVVSALDPAMQAKDGPGAAHGSGPADRDLSGHAVREPNVRKWIVKLLTLAIRMEPS